MAKLLDNTNKANKLKSVYVSDIKGALHSLQTQRGRPPFPESLWKSVLLNQHVNLRQVLEDHYALTPTYMESIALGNKTEITINWPTLSKLRQVQTHGEWIWMLTWEKYEGAVCYAYPH